MNAFGKWQSLLHLWIQESNSLWTTELWWNDSQLGNVTIKKITTFVKMVPIWFKISFQMVSNGYVLTFFEQKALVVFPKYFMYRILKSNGSTSILSLPKSDIPKSCSYASRFSPKVHAFPCFTTIQSVIILMLSTVLILISRLNTIQSSCAFRLNSNTSIQA